VASGVNSVSTFVSALGNAVGSYLYTEFQAEVNCIHVALDLTGLDKKRTTSSDEYRLIVFGSDSQPASSTAALIINASMHGNLNITSNITMVDCMGSCDTFQILTTNAAQFLTIYSIFIYVMIFLQLI